jgi:succinoglycan biosynthesis transport protein ExoP
MAMEDEIDLRKYFGVLIRHWKLIVGLAVLSSVVALAVSFLLPPTYKSTALVVITRPVYQLQFDPHIPSLPIQQQPSKAYPELALSDDLKVQVISTLGDQLKSNDRDLAKFSANLTAEPGGDPSLVLLSASGTDPQATQLIANTWARLYVTYTNQIYQQSSTQASFFEAQAAEARTKLEAAEQALIDYQGRNQLNIVAAQLTSQQTQLSNYLNAQRTIALIIQDARSLQQQLAQQTADTPSSLSDQLAALYLQVNALNSQTTPFPIQLQINGTGPLASRTIAEQAGLLTASIKVLQDKSIEIQQQITALQPNILSLQQAQQDAQVKLDRLTRDRDVARDTYLSLTRKVDETRVASQDNNNGVQLASLAAVPTEPVSPRKGFNAILGGFLGLVLGVISAFAIEARQARNS